MPRKVFPYASGSVANMEGAQEGRVIIVNALSDVIPAFQATGRRMIVPRVAGYCDFTDTQISSSSSWDFEYLGGFAPGDGVVLRGGQLRLRALKNFVIRGLKARRGIPTPMADGDALAIVDGSAPDDCENAIIDSSSFYYGNDEVFSASIKNGIIQWCIIAEPLHRAGNTKGDHGFGGLWARDNMSFHHNLFSSCFDRMPLFQNTRLEYTGPIDFRNNVVFSWIFRGLYVSQDVKNLNLVKNQFVPTNATRAFGGSSGELNARENNFAVFAGSSLDNIPAIYPFGNKLTTQPTMTDAVSSQTTRIRGTSTTNTNNLRASVVQSTAFALGYTYDFDETVEQSNDAIIARVGYPKRDATDQRVIDEFVNWMANPDLTNLVNPPYQITKRGSLTNILGLIDRPQDVGDYITLDTTSNPVLTGPAPHYLPSWFITKYNLNPALDYISAGTKVAAPHRFIIFGKADEGINLSQFGGSVNYADDLIYNVYQVLYFHITGEINLLESPTFTLTVQSIGGGTTNISTGEFIPSESVFLQATPDTGKRFVRWERLISSVWTSISTSNPFNFLMPSTDATVRAVFEDAPAPPVVTGDRFFARNPA